MQAEEDRFERTLGEGLKRLDADLLELVLKTQSEATGMSKGTDRLKNLPTVGEKRSGFLNTQIGWLAEGISELRARGIVPEYSGEKALSCTTRSVYPSISSSMRCEI